MGKPLVPATYSASLPDLTHRHKAGGDEACASIAALSNAYQQSVSGICSPRLLTSAVMASSLSPSHLQLMQYLFHRCVGGNSLPWLGEINHIIRTLCDNVTTNWLLTRTLLVDNRIVQYHNRSIVKS